MLDQCSNIWPSLVIGILFKLPRDCLVKLLEQAAHIADKKLALV
jgi:hypothetical protein